MTHTYKVDGMTCSSCEGQVKSHLLTVPHILSVDISMDSKTATIDMERHIPIETLQKALAGNGRFRIHATTHHEAVELARDWFSTYKPVLLLFLFLLGTTVAAEAAAGKFDWMRAMNHFMAGFFIAFSFFKFLNLPGFADSYATYDIIARRWHAWGYVYAFVELGLGLAFLTGFQPWITNMTTLLIMSLSLAGVVQSLLSGNRVRCACLGDVFNLPMSTVTVLEDGLMIGMSAIMLLLLQ
jgi:copper chaperone CopZ